MFRWLAICVVLGLATIAIMSLALGKNPYPFDNKSSVVDPVNPGPTSTELPRSTLNYRKPSAADSDQFLLIHDAHARAVDIQNVPSEREGRILFIGTEIPENQLPKGPELEKLIKDGKIIEQKLGFLVTKIDGKSGKIDEKPIEFVNRPGEFYRLCKKNEPLKPGSLEVARLPFYFRKLEKGDRVKKGDLIGIINPEIELLNLNNKIMSFAKAEAERVASEKMREEAQKRYESIVKSGGKDSVSQQELRTYKLEWEKYTAEEIAKKNGVGQALSELDSSEAMVRMHEIRAQISGRIKTIYKYRGDGVKITEPILQIENEDNLRIDGSIDVADAQLLKEVTPVSEGTPVSIEPSHAESAENTLQGHTREIKCITVTSGPKVRILSGSEDRSLRVWDAMTGRQMDIISRPDSSPRAVASARFPDNTTRALIGWSDGKLHLLNLDAIEDGDCFEVSRAHQNGVNSVSINSDATYALSAGEDRSVSIWKIQPVENRYELKLYRTIKEAHSSTISCVQFVVAGPSNEFYSVGQNELRVWKMEKDQNPVEKFHFDHRSGAVSFLGNDGKSVLFDEGGELRLRSLSDDTWVAGKLQNPPGSSPFTNMAVFAPNRKTILTNVAADGRLQLWRAPVSQGRGSELRQFNLTNRNNKGSVQCGAFAPDSSFVVTAQDQDIMIWKMPSDQEINAHLEGRLIQVGRSVENGSRQVPISAELINQPPPWFTPGTNATIVIDRKKKSDLNPSKP